MIPRIISINTEIRNKKPIILFSVIIDSASNMIDIQRVILKYLLSFIIITLTICNANIF